MMVKRVTFFMLAIVFGLSVAVPQVASAQEAGAFTRLGFGARGVALSNALSADISGNASPFYNPALAPFVGKQTLSASAALLRFDRQLQFLEFASPLRPRAGVAAGMIHAGVSNIDGRDNSGFHTEDYAVDEFAFFLAFGLKFSERASGGLALQLFRSDLFNDISAVNSIGLDFGMTIQVLPQTRLALVAEDLLASFSYDTAGLLGDAGKTTDDPFPRRIRLGASHQLPGIGSTIFAEYEISTTSREARTQEVQIVSGVPQPVVISEDLTIVDSRLRLGGEYQLSPEFSVRAGIDQIRSDIGGIKPSFGFSVVYPVGNLLTGAEYAFVLEPYAVGTMHFLTLKIFL
ncbi:MAG: hypothetical protein HKN43_04560 [Rhodothermales bacterium]|nr:hypothetical protein [Rhodothermales bacterium]